MPSVPIEMPSLTVIVPKSCGIAPAARSRRLRAPGQPAEAQVAGRDRAVAAGDADDRLPEVGVAEADRAQHRAVGRALAPSVMALLAMVHGGNLGRRGGGCHLQESALSPALDNRVNLV